MLFQQLSTLGQDSRDPASLSGLVTPVLGSEKT